MIAIKKAWCDGDQSIMPSFIMYVSYMLCVTNNWLLNANGVGTGPFKPPDYWIRIGLFQAKNPATALSLKIY